MRNSDKSTLYGTERDPLSLRSMGDIHYIQKNYTKAMDCYEALLKNHGHQIKNEDFRGIIIEMIDVSSKSGSDSGHLKSFLGSYINKLANIHGPNDFQSKVIEQYITSGVMGLNPGMDKGRAKIDYGTNPRNSTRLAEKLSSDNAATNANKSPPCYKKYSLDFDGTIDDLKHYIMSKSGCYSKEIEVNFCVRVKSYKAMVAVDKMINDDKKSKRHSCSF